MRKSKPMPTLTMTAETIDQENPEGLDNSLRILANILVREYVRVNSKPTSQAAVPGPEARQRAQEAPGPTQNRLLDIDGLSLYLSMPKSTLYTWVSTRKIPEKAIVRLGRALRFDRVEIDAWVERQRASVGSISRKADPEP